MFALFIFIKVSGIQRALQVLVKWSEDQVHSECSPTEVARQLTEVNDIILEVIVQVIQYRQQKAEIFQPNMHMEAALCEYLPWTASVGVGGLREALLKQVYLVLVITLILSFLFLFLNACYFIL